MTPAMEQVVELKKKTTLTTLSLRKSSPCMTRSRGAQLKRKFLCIFLNVLCNLLFFYKYIYEVC